MKLYTKRKISEVFKMLSETYARKYNLMEGKIQLKSNLQKMNLTVC